MWISINEKQIFFTVFDFLFLSCGCFRCCSEKKPSENQQTIFRKRKPAKDVNRVNLQCTAAWIRLHESVTVAFCMNDYDLRIDTAAVVVVVAAAVVFVLLFAYWKWCDTPRKKKKWYQFSVYHPLTLSVFVLPKRAVFCENVDFRTWHNYMSHQTKRKKDVIAIHSQQKPSSRRNDLFIIWNYLLLSLTKFHVQYENPYKIKHIPFRILMFMFVFVIIVCFLYLVSEYFVWDDFK